MFGKIIQFAKVVNSKNIQSFKRLQCLKGENFFDTFSNVKSYNNLSIARKEVKTLKNKFEKLPERLSKSERKLAKIIQKQRNKELRQTYMQSIKDAEMLPRDLRDKELKRIRQSIFEDYLKLKQNQGKTISKLDRIRLNNPNFRNAEKLILTRLKASLILNACNIGDITDAYNNIGIGAAAEEVAKTTAMGFLGLSALKFTNTQLKNMVTATSLYCPAGRFFNKFSLPLSILFSLNVKPVMDKLWITEYEKNNKKA